MSRQQDDNLDRARCGNAEESFQEASKGQFDEPAMAKGSKYSARPFDALRFVTGPGLLKTGGRKGRSYGCKRLYSSLSGRRLPVVIFEQKRIDESDRAETSGVGQQSK